MPTNSADFIQLRFAAGKDKPANTKFSERSQLPFEIGGHDLLGLTNTPDVAHHATTVALIVGRNDDDRQGADLVRSTRLIVS